ncbi:DUF2336 domain-containing protein [Microbaculum marinum]|uniref:DUF2336 domain-containing protein n=1 Tax=Microbaculum marinum TaxID=1764581 RepID=A0AAW9RT48_9HYPH
MLARKSPGSPRRELLHAVSAHLLDERRDYTRRELALFDDVICNLLGQVDLDARIELSAKVADADRPVGELAHRLARDEAIAVAGPVLARYGPFDDGILAGIAATSAQDRLLAIAGRQRLSPAVTEILLGRGSGEVLRVLAGNLGAELSVAAFGRILDSAEADANLLTALSYRADMPASLVPRALDILPPDHRRRLAALIAADRDEGAGLTALPPDWQLRRRQVSGWIARIGDGLTDLDDVVRLLAREDRHDDLAVVLSRFSGLGTQAVMSSLFRADHDAVAVVLRALELSEPAVSAVADLRGRRLNLPSGAKRRMMRAWTVLDSNSAQKIMRLMRARPPG